MEKKLKEEDTVSMIPTGFDAADLELGPGVDVLKFLAKKHCFVRDTSFNNLEDEYGLQTNSVFTGKATVFLADPPYSTGSARGHSSSTHGVFLKSDMENAVRLMRYVMDLGAHAHIICSDLMFFH